MGYVETSPLEPPKHECMWPLDKKSINEMVSSGGRYQWTRAYLECCVMAMVEEAGKSK